MKSGTDTQAMDLSLKHHPQVQLREINKEKEVVTPVFKPQPRPAWSILWYRSIWPKFVGPLTTNPSFTSPDFFGSSNRTNLTNLGSVGHTNSGDQREIIGGYGFESNTGSEPENNDNLLESMGCGVDLSCNPAGSRREEKFDCSIKRKPQGLGSSVTDVATCDGPVQFHRVSNPNFALTVEHRECSRGVSDGLPPPPPSTSSKTYLCIYCNQSFKSLFCYQKHKKRHLNPVSVDITANNSVELTNSLPESTLHGADLNVQFFPCKKCGSKFPSYYFVHKHKKVCDMTDVARFEPT